MDKPQPAPKVPEDKSDPRLGRVCAVDNGFTVGVGSNDRIYKHTSSLTEAIALMLEERHKPFSERDTENGFMVVIDKMEGGFLLSQIVNGHWHNFAVVPYNPDPEIQLNSLVNAAQSRLVLRSAQLGKMKLIPGGDSVPN